MNWYDILERAGWTAVQGALASIPVAQLSAAIAGGEIDALAQLGLTAVGAGVGAAVSFIKTVAQERLAKLDTRASRFEDLP